MSFKLSKLTTQQKVLIAALTIGVIAVIYYAFSGKGGFDQNTRELKNSDPQVQDVVTQEGQNGEKDMQVKCQDGSSYDVYYPPGEENYASLAASKCTP